MSGALLTATRRGCDSATTVQIWIGTCDAYGAQATSSTNSTTRKIYRFASKRARKVFEESRARYGTAKGSAVGFGGTFDLSWARLTTRGAHSWCSARSCGAVPSGCPRRMMMVLGLRELCAAG